MAAGFVEFQITSRVDVFSGSVHESSAADFGALGICFRARRPQNEEEWEMALAALTCEVPTWPTSPLLKR